MAEREDAVERARGIKKSKWERLKIGDKVTAQIENKSVSQPYP